MSTWAYYRYCWGETYRASQAEEEAIKVVEKVFWVHPRRYGSRRLVVELQQEEGVQIGRYKIRSIMQQQGLKAIQPYPKIINV